MISTIQKKISGALSSFTSAKQPKLLQRPAIEISSQPNDPAAAPQLAHMPPKRSGTPSSRNTKRQKGAKATQFLVRHFNGEEEENDPIESSSPLGPRVHRVKSPPRLPTGKKQDRSPNFTCLKKGVSKSEITHKHLMVDDERSLTLVNGPPRPDAVLIEIPGSEKSNRNSSSTMRAGSGLRPLNTLDMPKQSQVHDYSRRKSEKPCVPSLAGFGPKTYAPGSRTGHSIRNGVGEPPRKRQRLDQAPTTNVRDEGAGAVSPYFSPLEDQSMTITRARTSTPRDTRRSPTKVIAHHKPVEVKEYAAVENVMRPALSSSRPSQFMNRFSSQRPTNGRNELLDESDPEDFTRKSKKARHGEGDGPHPGLSTEARQIEKTPDTSRTSMDTSSKIDAIFPSTYSVDQVKLPGGESPKRSHITIPAARTSCPPNDSSKFASASDSGSNQASKKGSQRRTSGVTSTRRKQVAGSSKSQDSRSKDFPLRVFIFGFLPQDSNYFAVIQGTTLNISSSESLLDDGPLWGLSLSKVLKINVGADDCSKLILHCSKTQGQPSNMMLLEFQSEDERADFVDLAREAYPDLFVETRVEIKNNKDFMTRAFQHQHKIFSEAQPKQSDHNTSDQPIREKRIVSDTISPHFPNQHQISATTFPKHPRLTSRLQASSSVQNTSDADSRIPTIITGRDRANHSSPPTSAQIFSSVRKEHTSGQTEPLNTGRLRSSSTRIAATKSNLRSDQSVDPVEGVKMPKKKYSQEHGLGEPWKTSLVYPKTGRRRETVEYDDLFRLDEDEFLNDNLIGFFLRYLEHHLEQTNPELAKRVYFYNSYFFERLMQTSKGKKGINYESVQKWTRNIDIFSRDFVVLPVNESLHWYVVIICNLSRLDTVEEDKEDIVENAKAVSEGSPIASNEEVDDAERDGTTESAHDKPTQQTTESLSHLSLSDNDKQVDELASSKNPFSSAQSPGPKYSPRKSGPGRRKGARHSLPKYDVGAPVIMTLDSLGLPRSSTCTALRQYIVEEAKNKRGWDIDGSLIKGMTARGIPTQPNFSDCGLYLCAYMEKFVLDPAVFVGKILQRQMDPNIDMPMMASEELRSRMRGMIRELHNEQEGKESAFSIPKIGSILLAPRESVTVEENVRSLHTTLQDDSEDELQQDQTSLIASKHARSSANLPARPATTKDSAPSPIQDRHPSPLSDIALPVTEILAKINGKTSSPFHPNSGTKETAITIDDDDDNDPTSVSVSAPVSTSKRIRISPIDFLDHPYELKAALKSNASKPLNPFPSSGDTRRTKDAAASKPREGDRSRVKSHDSADSVNTQFLQSGESYNMDKNGKRGGEHRLATSPPASGLRDKEKRKTADGKKKREREMERQRQRGVVVMVPDSQEDEWEEIGDGRFEGPSESETEARGARTGTGNVVQVYEDPDRDRDHQDQDLDRDDEQVILHGV